MNPSAASFPETVRGLLAGDFSRLEPLFRGEQPAILGWFDQGLFRDEPEALAEAFTCACWNGVVPVVKHLLDQGADPNGGIGTGLNAFHWAANRGQVEVVEILIHHGAALETRNSYGGTVLGCTVWSALNEPRSGQIPAIAALLKAGADVSAAQFPTGNAEIDRLLAPYRES